MKAILFVLPRLPYPFYSGQARHCHQQSLRMADLGYQVHLLYFRLPFANRVKILADHKYASIFSIDISILDLLLIVCTAAKGFFAATRPLQAAYLASPLIARKFEAYMTRYDNIELSLHFFSLRTASLWFLPSALPRRTVVDLIDSVSLNLSNRLSIDRVKRPSFIPINMFQRRELALLRSFEAALPTRPTLTAYSVVSSIDLKCLSVSSLCSSVSDHSSKLLLSSIATDEFIAPDLLQWPPLGSKRSDVVFFGSLSYAPNIHALSFLLEEIMPLVWAENSMIRLNVAGSSPSAVLRRRLRLMPRVVLHESPACMRSIVTQSALSLAPMISGSGQQNKVIDSIAFGVPVVCTSLAAVPLGLTDEHVFICDDPHLFARIVLSVVEGSLPVDSHLLSSYEFVKEHFSWSSVVNRFLPYY